jgi:hypothetical protein
MRAAARFHKLWLMNKQRKSATAKVAWRKPRGNNAQVTIIVHSANTETTWGTNEAQVQKTMPLTPGHEKQRQSKQTS